MKALTYLLILLLTPVAFNGCGEEERLVVSLSQLEEYFDKRYSMIEVPSVPTYQVGLDTVGWFDCAPLTPYPNCKCGLATVGMNIFVLHGDDCCYENTTKQPITKEIRKPKIRIWLEPDQHARLRELLGDKP